MSRLLSAALTFSPACWGSPGLGQSPVRVPSRAMHLSTCGGRQPELRSGMAFGARARDGRFKIQSYWRKDSRRQTAYRSRLWQQAVSDRSWDHASYFRNDATTLALRTPAGRKIGDCGLKAHRPAEPSVKGHRDGKGESCDRLRRGSEVWRCGLILRRGNISSRTTPPLESQENRGTNTPCTFKGRAQAWTMRRDHWRRSRHLDICVSRRQPPWPNRAFSILDDLADLGRGSRLDCAKFAQARNSFSFYRSETRTIGLRDHGG